MEAFKKGFAMQRLDLLFCIVYMPECISSRFNYLACQWSITALINLVSQLPESFEPRFGVRYLLNVAVCSGASPEYQQRLGKTIRSVTCAAGKATVEQAPRDDCREPFSGLLNVG
jgi:hypothetical protein